MYMLATNAISAIMNENVMFMQRLRAKSFENVCMSSIAWAEIKYGIYKKGSVKLQKSAERLAKKIRIVPFNQQTADIYAKLRVDIEKQGKNLSPLDMEIAACAVANSCVLVTNDQAFHRLELDELPVEDWTV
ncbi:MAG: PIN domain-containing protein [Neisseriaceae bacterium]|nr:PIN domain-containing protein [Neisseriaceae bacterium]